jgi:hypothetical protein
MSSDVHERANQADLGVIFYIRPKNFSSTKKCA